VSWLPGDGSLAVCTRLPAPMPTVSVILPAFNRTRYLRQALDSIYGQTFVDWETIVADDGSAEETRSFLRGITDLRVRTIWLAHSGNPSRVRNQAIGEARGRYLAFLDSDDLWAAGKLEKQLEALGQRPHCQWSYTAHDRVDADGGPFDDGSRMALLPEGWIAEPLLDSSLCIAMPTVMAERDLVLGCGGFDERQQFGEYHDMCLRLALRSPVVALKETLCSVRAHDEHYSGDRIAAYRSWGGLYAKMAALAPTGRLRAHCRRKRAEASLIVAGLQGDQGDYRSAWATLGKASRFSWRYPRWWLGALKAVARPLTPDPWVGAYRRTRR
jgi:glycosyltransferase involved in cell wall biosynthesis